MNLDLLQPKLGDSNSVIRSFVQRSPTDCGASLYVIKKPRKRGG